jgi:alcohol dehydrogenase class IV
MTSPSLARSPRITFGPGAVSSLALITAELGDDRPPLVLAGHTATDRPWLPEVRGKLPRHVFTTIPGSYPTWASVDRVADLMTTLNTGVVIAIGGGSVMDTAKVAAARAAEIGQGPRHPVAAVPTTPGSGAEATPFATVWDFDGGRKHSYSHDDLTPDAAIVDPDLIRTLPPAVLGSAVLDTLAQGMEAAWSSRATPESIAHGIAAVTLAAGNLERLLADPQDLAARSAISLAGLYSGQAIATSRTTLCHALSYPLTLNYGVWHGHACGLTLGAVLRYNAEVADDDCTHPGGPAEVHAIIDRIVAAMRCPSPAAAAARIDELIAAAGLAAYRDGDYNDALLAGEALSYDRAGNNPRRFDKNQLTALIAAMRVAPA